MQDGAVRLRPFEPRDVEAALSWYRDPFILRMSEGPQAQPFDRDRVERMYRILSGIGELYMIEVYGVDGWRTVGDATLAPHTLPIVIGEAEYRGKGVGGKVLDLLVARARALGWSELHVQRVYLYNEASRRLFMSRGFEPVATRADELGASAEYRLDLAL